MGRGRGTLRRAHRADPGDRRRSSATSATTRRRTSCSVSVVDANGNGPQSGLDLQDARLVEQLQEAFQRGQNGDADDLGADRLELAAGAASSCSASRCRSPAASSGSSWRWRACSRSARSRNRTGGSGVFEVYVVDNRGRLIAHSDPDRRSSEDLSRVEIVRDLRPAREVAPRRSPPGRGRAAARERRVRDDAVQPEGRRRRRPAHAGHLHARPRRLRLGRHRPDRRRARRTSPPSTCAGTPSSWSPSSTALAVVLGSLLAGQISRPVQKLAEGARRLAGGDYATRVTRAQPQRGRRPRRRLQPDGRGDPEGDRGDPAAGRGEQGALHGLDPHARERHRREGPLHPRPLRARRLLLRRAWPSTSG